MPQLPSPSSTVVPEVGAASPSLSFSLEEYENPSDNVEIWEDRICLTRGVYSLKIRNHTPYIL